jgi:oxaloacetate decarboxylase alpha subunit
MRHVRIVDTTLRDGQQSLWAYRMRAGAMIPAMADLDAAGFEAIEFVTPGPQFARMVRDLKEDPWVWLREGAARARRTPLRIHGSVASRLSPIPVSTQHLMLEKLASMGIRTTRASDPWNDFAALDTTVRMMAEHGIDTVVNLVYSVSPRHTVDYFVQKTHDAVARKPHRICLKDVGGLMTVEAAHQVIPAVLEAAGEVPLEFHAHCTNGLAPYISLLAADYGVRVLHAGVPPLADGDAQPSVLDLVRNLRTRGHDVRIDLDPLVAVQEHLELVRSREGFPAGRPRVFDASVYDHQVPGGMISNLRFQLRAMGMEDRLTETLQEAAQVRVDLGYPIMVTPLAQFVGSQAAINVLTGTRYGQVTDEVIQYAMGMWGREASDVMDPDLKADILRRPRSQEIRGRAAAEPELEEVRRSYGAGLDDFALLTRVFAGVGGGPLDLDEGNRLPQTYADYRRQSRTLQDVLRSVDASRSVRTVYLRRGDVTVGICR